MHPLAFLLILPCPQHAQVLEARQRARLKEAESTVAKRLAWSKAQCARAGGGGGSGGGEGGKGPFDHVVSNVDDRGQVGWRLLIYKFGFHARAQRQSLQLVLQLLERCCWENQHMLGVSSIAKHTHTIANALSHNPGVSFSQGGDQLPEPHHPQQAAGAARLCAGLFRPHRAQQVCVRLCVVCVRECLVFYPLLHQCASPSAMLRACSGLARVPPT